MVPVSISKTPKWNNPVELAIRNGVSFAAVSFFTQYDQEGSPGTVLKSDAVSVVLVPETVKSPTLSV